MRAIACHGSICLASVSPSPYKVALHKSRPRQAIAPDALTSPIIYVREKVSGTFSPSIFPAERFRVFNGSGERHLVVSPVPDEVFAGRLKNAFGAQENRDGTGIPLEREPWTGASGKTLLKHSDSLLSTH